MLSNLMNIGKKKTSSLENPEKCVDTSGEKGSCARLVWVHGFSFVTVTVFSGTHEISVTSSVTKQQQMMLSQLGL